MKISSSKFKNVIVFLIVFGLVYFPGWLKIEEARAAIAFRAAATATTVEGLSIIISKPTGTVTDDVMVAIIFFSMDGTTITITPPVGWTLILQTTSAANRQAMASFRKVAVAGEPASYTWTWDTTSDASGAIDTYSGVDTTTPVDVSGGQINASSLSVTAPSITTTVANTMLVGGFGSGNNATVPTFTPATGMTERTDIGVNGGLEKNGLETADELQAVAGASGTRIATATVAGTNIGQLIALKPTAGAPADLSWDTGAADFEIWAGATANDPAVLTWDNGTLICSTSLTDDNGRISTCGSINKSQKYRIQTVLESIGGTAASMNGAADPVDQKNVKTFWAGTNPTISAATDCGFNDLGADNGATTCNVAFNGNDVRVTNTGAGNVVIAATTGTEGFMYLITTDSNVSLSDSSTFMNADIDTITEDSSRITIGQKRRPGLFIRGKITIRGKVVFR